MDKIKARPQLFIPLLLVFSYAGNAEAFFSCRYTFDVKVYTDLCFKELEREWRPKLNPNAHCASLIDEAEKFDMHFNNGDIEINENCTRKELMNISARAALALSKAKAKGWTTLEQYFSY